jgi:hypothetical protein
MNIDKLLQEWEAHYRDSAEVISMCANLPLSDAARIKALAEMYSGRTEEHIMVDLLGAALDELEAALPYVQGKKVIGEDEFGDPVYEDEGPTPRFLNLTRKYIHKMEEMEEPTL